ncbi:MAG: NADH-quinone oxidoreductase subunit NuoH [Candidatus Coatesbacteria bacterium]
MTGALDGIFVEGKRFLLNVLSTLLPNAWYAALSPLVSALVISAAILVFAPVTMMFLTWLERKTVARFQDRYGPNRVGPAGLLQPIADGIKMFLKEDIVPRDADVVMHFLIPALATAPVFMLFLVLPFGRDMTALDLNVGLLFFLGMSAVQTPLVIAAGWSSRSKYPVLGSMRAAAQILSYEIPMVVVLVAVVMSSGTMSTASIVDAQASGWFIGTPWGLAAFVVFVLAGAAEANRTPFDLAEAESELAAGFHTEFTGMKFAMFQMAEFLGTFASGGLAATVFLGGWQGPQPYLPGFLQGVAGVVPSWAWFHLKLYAMFFLFMWFRGTFPRLRIDQLLGFAWKFLFPMSLLVIVAAAIWHFMLAAGPGVPPPSVGRWLAAWGVCGGLLGAGWLGLSALIEREFARMNRPREVVHAR